MMLLCACGDDGGATPPAVDAGAARDTGVDAGSSGCAEPDRVCPVEEPVATGACDLAESCDYPDEGGDYTWTYMCTGGQWSGESDCRSPPIGTSCPAPRSQESCREPIAYAGSGVTIEIGPGGIGPFRPFEPDEIVPVVYGPQGAPMVSTRVRVRGAEDVSACIAVETWTRIDDFESRPSARSMVLHCGITRTMWRTILERCDGIHTLAFSLRIPGVAEATVPLRFETEPCGS